MKPVCDEKVSSIRGKEEAPWKEGEVVGLFGSSGKHHRIKPRNWKGGKNSSRTERGKA